MTTTDHDLVNQRTQRPKVAGGRLDCTVREWHVDLVDRWAAHIGEPGNRSAGLRAILERVGEPPERRSEA